MLNKNLNFVILLCLFVVTQGSTVTFLDFIIHGSFNFISSIFGALTSTFMSFFTVKKLLKLIE
jgi:hypothetical protein